jgi:hypothetical protein
VESRKSIFNNTAGFRPAPHPLFEKSGAKTLTLKSKIAHICDFEKVLIKLFQKFMGFGAKPQGLNLKIDFRGGGI